ncbi:Panacea domain-containing protein [Thalassospira xiamenensis]|uniref:Antitoxin SocA-like Panacea domain-containing protein n=1 Tax=Thalassospira xiamenensis TaxID=220697 RepID=A0A285TXY8_9PROT|nr:hypothetical protein [Thalassospira xiamenensis]SOC30963.1 hypothetical protein SAMN05428964_11135 [Thalassospira xiamenensis]
MAYSSAIVANKLLKLAAKNGRRMDERQMMMLIYLCHGFHLAETREALVSEPVISYRYGPVFSQLHREHLHQLRGAAISKLLPVSLNEEELSFKAEKLIENVFEFVSFADSVTLSTLFNIDDGPASCLFDVKPGTVVSDEDIRLFFREFEDWEIEIPGFNNEEDLHALQKAHEEGFNEAISETRKVQVHLKERLRILKRTGAAQKVQLMQKRVELYRDSLAALNAKLVSLKKEPRETLLPLGAEVVFTDSKEESYYLPAAGTPGLIVGYFPQSLHPHTVLIDDPNVPGAKTVVTTNAGSVIETAVDNPGPRLKTYAYRPTHSRTEDDGNGYGLEIMALKSNDNTLIFGSPRNRETHAPIAFSSEILLLDIIPYSRAAEVLSQCGFQTVERNHAADGPIISYQKDEGPRGGPWGGM